MNKLPISDYKSFGDLPLDQFDQRKFSVYVLDKKWNYVFVNSFVHSNLRLEEEKLEGKNMWERFPEMYHDPVFAMLKRNSENNMETNIETVSPLTGQRINIIGKPLNDCYLFYTTILPNKEDLLRELRDVLKRKPD